MPCAGGMACCCLCGEQACRNVLTRLPPTARSLANNDRVGGAIKAAAQLVDSTASQACRAAALSFAVFKAARLLCFGGSTGWLPSHILRTHPPTQHPTALPDPPQVVFVLRQYPLGRLVVFAYVIGVHLFIYILLHRWESSSTGLLPCGLQALGVSRLRWAPRPAPCLHPVTLTPTPAPPTAPCLLQAAAQGVQPRAGGGGDAPRRPNLRRLSGRPACLPRLPTL